MGNIITSMRLLTSLDWVSFFENTNRLERVLRQDLAEVYPEMDFSSRNRYRDAVEKLSKRSKFSETAIANLAIQLSEQSKGVDGLGGKQVPLAKHIGYWLVDDGRKELERLIDVRPTWTEQVIHSVQARPKTAYFGALVVIVSLFTTLIGMAIQPLDLEAWLYACLMLLLVVPISEMALSCVNALLTRVLPVRLLPKLEFRDGISADYRHS